MQKYGSRVVARNWRLSARRPLRPSNEGLCSTITLVDGVTIYLARKQMPVFNRTRSIQGFTLIELIMVIVVFSITAVVLLSSFSSMGTTVILGEQLQISKSLSQECSEFIVTSRRDTVNGFANVTNTRCDFLPLPSGYTRTVSVATFDFAANPVCPSGASCKSVLVRISRSGKILAETTTMVVNY